MSLRKTVLIQTPQHPPPTNKLIKNATTVLLRTYGPALPDAAESLHSLSGSRRGVLRADAGLVRHGRLSLEIVSVRHCDIINSPGEPGRERPVSGAISYEVKSGSKASGASAPLLSPMTFDAPGYRTRLEAVARIIQGDGVIGSPRRRARFSAPRTESRGQACLVS
jgi:hypothetical protein